MDVLSQAKRALRNIWDQGGEEVDDFTAAAHTETRAAGHDRYEHDTTYGDSGGSGGSLLNNPRRLRSINHAPHSNEKNIYTLRPKSLDEAAIAADYLKTGSAVVINHEVVDRATSLRIIDFMSGVCYGLDNQGHAMKLGETIFLFTPGEYEINSDEVDYGENRDHFFRAEERAAAAASAGVGTVQTATSQPAATPTQKTAPVATPSYSRSVTPSGQVTSYMGAPHVERRSWER